MKNIKICLVTLTGINYLLVKIFTYIHRYQLINVSVHDHHRTHFVADEIWRAHLL